MSTTTKTETGEGNAPREVTEQEWTEACAVAQDRVKLGRLRAYLLPGLIQDSKNIASAAACSISDFEAMRRGKDMLRRIESEEA